MKPFSQVLRIEIDGWDPIFNGCHTPGIIEVLQGVIEGIGRGIQLCAYPRAIGYRGKIVGMVYLDETNVRPGDLIEYRRANSETSGFGLVTNCLVGDKFIVSGQELEADEIIRIVEQTADREVQP